MRKQHELSLRLATPKIGSTAALNKRTVGTGSGVLRYFIDSSIYNEGDLPAKKLHGTWNLACSDSGQNRSSPIWKDYLGRKPFDLESHELRGTDIGNTINSGKEMSIALDIEFEYFGVDETTAQKYHAKYQYDRERKQIFKVED